MENDKNNDGVAIPSLLGVRGGSTDANAKPISYRDETG